MASPLDNIKHLVVLMMENRSFDHMFGMMMGPDWPIDGLMGTEANTNSKDKSFTVTTDASYTGDLTPDPGHHFPDVNMQIFGNFEGNPSGPLMQGFVKAYEAHTHDPETAGRIMNCFDPSRIPVLTTLAKQYAVCDRWFASVPGPTLPNRSFIHSATSVGRTDMSPVWFDESKSIYELLDEFGKRGSIFYHDSTMAMTFKALGSSQSKWFGLIDDFHRACSQNTLPDYSFIEPQYFDSPDGAVQASDQHPDHDVRSGEDLILDVYNSLRSHPDVWKSTILVIVYDEHGGLYDHVEPPAAVSPDGKIVQDPGENVAQIPPFEFTRLGVRVPAVVISAYIDPGQIDHTIYDHTSVIATARKLFLGDKAAANFLTERDRNAKTFEHLLTRDSVRDDKIDFKALQDLMPPVANLQKKNNLDSPLSDHQKMMVQHAFDVEQKFLPNLKSGVTPDQIKTERQASLYLRQVGDELRKNNIQKAGGGVV
ncbi:MAG TPA: alkaline phosphatase family protein [Bryobacteraceae bacterium]|jgi:phospholipase C